MNARTIVSVNQKILKSAVQIQVIVNVRLDGQVLAVKQISMSAFKRTYVIQRQKFAKIGMVHTTANVKMDLEGMTF